MVSQKNTPKNPTPKPIWFDFASDLWIKGLSAKVVMDAILNEYEIILDDGAFNYIRVQYPDEFPKHTKGQISGSLSDAHRYYHMNRGYNRKIAINGLK